MKRIPTSLILLSAILILYTGPTSALPPQGAEPVESPTPAPVVPPVPMPVFTPTTPLTTTLSPPSDCQAPPTGGFLRVWESDQTLQAVLGCPTSYHPRIVPQAWKVGTSYQPFEHGMMIWSDHQGWYAQPVIFVILTDGAYLRFDDTFDPETDPVSTEEEPPSGLSEPVLGFGKVWTGHPVVRNAVGWATADETPGDGYYQLFMGGNMVWLDQTNSTYVFVSRDGVNLVWVFNVPFAP